jgi:hypothetical protein
VCRSVPRSSFPRTPSESQRRFAAPAARCRRRGRRGLPGRVSPDIAGRTVSGARVADLATLDRCRLVDDASAPRAGTRSRRRRGPRSIGPGPSRCVLGWRTRPESFAARPESFEARGFSDLRAGFVLRDESSRRRRSRALHGSGRAAPEHGSESPVLGTRPPRLATLRSTNWARIPEEPAVGDAGDAWARISEEPDAGTRGREGGGWSPAPGAGTRGRGGGDVTRRHVGACLHEFVFRSNRRHDLAVAFGTLPGLGAMREPTTYDTIMGSRDIRRIICMP